MCWVLFCYWVGGEGGEGMGDTTCMLFAGSKMAFMTLVLRTSAIV